MRRSFLKKAIIPVLMAVIIAIGCFAVAFSSEGNSFNKGDAGDALGLKDYDIQTYVAVNGTETPSAPAGNVVTTAAEYAYMMANANAGATYTLGANFDILTNKYFANTFAANLDGKDATTGLKHYIRYSYNGNRIEMGGAAFAGGFAGLVSGKISNIVYAMVSDFFVNIPVGASPASLNGRNGRSIGGFAGMIAGDGASVEDCDIFIDASLVVNDYYNAPESRTIRVGLLAGAITTSTTANFASSTGLRKDRIVRCNVSTESTLGYNIPSMQTANDAKFRLNVGLIGETEHSDISNSVFDVSIGLQLMLQGNKDGGQIPVSETSVGGLIGQNNGSKVSDSTIDVVFPTIVIQTYRALVGGVMGSNLNGPRAALSYNKGTQTKVEFVNDTVRVGSIGGQIGAWGNSDAHYDNGTSTIGLAVGGFVGMTGEGLTFKDSTFRVDDINFFMPFHSDGGQKIVGLFAGRQIRGNGTTDAEISIVNASIDAHGALKNFNYAGFQTTDTGTNSFQQNSGIITGYTTSEIQAKINIQNLWILKSAESGAPSENYRIIGENSNSYTISDSFKSKVNFVYYDVTDGHFDAKFDAATSNMVFTPLKNGSGGAYFFDRNRNNVTDVSMTGFMNKAPGSDNLGTSDFVTAGVSKTFNTAVVPAGTTAPLTVNDPNYYEQYTYTYSAQSTNGGIVVYTLFAMEEIRTAQELNRFGVTTNKGYNGNWMEPSLALLSGKNAIEVAGGTALLPIGTEQNPFNGVFDGKDVAITAPAFNKDYKDSGLFGVNRGVVKNVNLTITGNGGLTFFNGYTSVNYGSVAGVNEGTIENASVVVTAGGVTVQNLSGATAFAGANIGGLVGVNKTGGSIKNASYNTSERIYFNLYNVASGAIVNVGAAIGKNESTASLSNIAITVTNSAGKRIEFAGSATGYTQNLSTFIGYVDTAAAGASYSNVAIVAPLDEKLGTNGSGAHVGVVAGDSAAAFTGLSSVWAVVKRDSTAAMAHLNGTATAPANLNKVILNTAVDYDVAAEVALVSSARRVRIKVNATSDYALAGWYENGTRLDVASGIDGAVFTLTGNVAGKTYTVEYISTNIYNVTDLQLMSQAVNAGMDFAGMTFRLENDVTVNGGVNFAPIGTKANPFRGSFNGNNRTVTITDNLTSDNAGLFGYVQANSTKYRIKKVAADNTVTFGEITLPDTSIYSLNVKLAGSITGTDSAGIIAGTVDGAEIGRVSTATLTTENIAGTAETYYTINRLYLPVGVSFEGITGITSTKDAGVAVGTAVNSKGTAFVGHITAQRANSTATLAVNGTANAAGFVGKIDGAAVNAVEIVTDGMTFTGANKGGLVGQITSKADNKIEQAVVAYNSTPADGLKYTVGVNALRTSGNFANVWAFFGNDALAGTGGLTPSNNYFNVLSVKFGNGSSKTGTANVTAKVNEKGAEIPKNVLFDFKSTTQGFNFAGISGITDETIMSPSYFPEDSVQGKFATAVFAFNDITSLADWAYMDWYNQTIGTSITFNLKSTLTIDGNYQKIGSKDLPFKSKLKGSAGVSIIVEDITLSGTDSKFALFGELSKEAAVTNLNVTIKGSVNTDYAAAIALENSGLIDSVSVVISKNTDNAGTVISTGSLIGKYAGGLVVNNRGTVQNCSFTVNGEFGGHIAGGIAAINGGDSVGAVVVIKNSSATYSESSVIIGVDGATVTANIGGLAGKSTADIFNVRIVVKGAFRSNLTAADMRFGGIASEISAGTVSGFNVSIASVGDKTQGSGDAAVNHFGGAAYSLINTGKITNETTGAIDNVISISGSSNISGTFAGIVADMRTNTSLVKGVRVEYVSESGKATIETGLNFGGGFGVVQNGTITDVTVEAKESFAFKSADTAAGFAVRLGANVTGVSVVLEASVEGDRFAAGFAAANTTGVSVSNNIIVIKNYITSATGKAALFNTAFASGVSKVPGVWVVLSNLYTAETAYSTTGEPIDCGVNVLRIVGKPSYVAQLNAAGKAEIGISGNGLTEKSPLYRDVNGRTLFDNSLAWTTDAVSGMRKLDTSKIDEKDLKLYLSLYDLDINGVKFGTASTIDSEFADFVEYNRNSYFKGVRFELQGDVTIAFNGAGIGSESVPFEGIFDGKGHTVNVSGSITGNGLFGSIGRQGEVRDLFVVYKPTGEGRATTIGSAKAQNVGGLAGSVYGAVKNVAVMFENPEDMSRHVRMIGDNAASIGIVAGFVADGITLENTWAVSLVNEYKAVGNQTDLSSFAANSLGVLGWITPELQWSADSRIIFKVPAPQRAGATGGYTNDFMGWYSNYSSGIKIEDDPSVTMTGVKQEGDYSLYYSNMHDTNADYVVSFFDPVITTQEQLIKLSAFSNNLPDFAVKVELGADITLGSATDATPLNFTPIGSSVTKPFGGTFASKTGSVFTVTIESNVVINAEYAGLFGVVTGSIFDFKLVVKTSKISGSKNAGNLAGNINGAKIANVAVESNVKQEAAGDFGGIAGSYFVSQSGNVWFVSNDYNIKPYVTGAATSDINTMYALNDVNAAGVMSNGSVHVSSFALDAVTFAKDAGSAGFIDADGVYTTDPTLAVSGIASMTGKKYYVVSFDTKIATEADIIALSARIADKSRETLNIAGVHYNMTASVTVTGAFTPIGERAVPFNGVFDGGGFELIFADTSSITGVQDAAPFGATSSTATIRNLIMRVYGTVNGVSSAGSIVAQNSGKLKNVVVFFNAKNFGSTNGGNAIRIIGEGPETALAHFENVWLVKESGASTIDLVPRSTGNYLVLVGKKLKELQAIVTNAGVTFRNIAGESNWYTDLSTAGTIKRSYDFVVESVQKQVYYVSDYKLHIETAADFANIDGYLVDAIKKSYDLTGVTFFQKNDIALGDSDKAFIAGGFTDLLVNGVSTQKRVTFASVYDGGGFSLQLNGNISVLAAQNQTSPVLAGVFGAVASRGAIKNLRVELNGKIEAVNNNPREALNPNKGKAYAGFIAYNAGVVENVAIVVGQNAAVNLQLATKPSASELPTASVTAGYTAKNAFINTWVVSTTRNVLKTAVINDSGANSLTLIGDTDNVSITFDGGKLKFTIVGGLFSDYVNAVEYSGPDFSSGAFIPVGKSNVAYQAANVTAAITDAGGLAQLAYDVNAGYGMAGAYTVSGVTITLDVTNFPVSIGTFDGTKSFYGSLTFSNDAKIVNNSKKPLFGSIGTGAEINAIDYEFGGVYDSNAVNWDIKGLFAVNNAGSVKGGSFVFSATGDAYDYALFFGSNTGSVSDAAFELKTNGQAGGKTVAAVVYDNNGVFSNATVNINGKIATTSAQGDAGVSAFAYSNDTNGIVRNLKVTVSGELRAQGGSSYFAGVSIENKGRLETVYVDFGDSAKIGGYVDATGAIVKSGTIYGIARDNPNRGVENTVVYYRQNLTLDTQYVYAIGGGTYSNSFVFTYNEYQNTNGQNMIVLNGEAALTFEFGADSLLSVGYTPSAGFVTSGLFDVNGNKLSGSDAGAGTFKFGQKFSGEKFSFVFIKNLLSDENDLRRFAEQVNSGATIGVEVGLQNDITINGSFTPIGRSAVSAFGGLFNGNGHTITINGSIVGEYAGLFGFVGANASIKDVNVTVAAGATIGDVSTRYAGALAAYIEGASIQNTKAANVVDRYNVITVLGTISANAGITGSSAGGAIGYAKGATIEDFMITLGAVGNTAARISADFAGGVIGQTGLGSALNGSLNIANVTNYGTIDGGTASGGVVGKSYVSITGVYNVNYGVISGGFKGLIIGNNIGSMANTFAIDTVGGLEAVGEYGGIGSGTNVWAIVAGDVPQDPIINYVSMSAELVRLVLENDGFDFAEHGTITVPLSDSYFTVWQDQKDKDNLAIEGVTANAYKIPFTDGATVVEGRYITVKVIDTIESLYDFEYFGKNVASFAPSAGANPFAHLATAGVKLGVDLLLDASSGHTAFDVNVPFNGQGHKITVSNGASVFKNATAVSDIVIDTNVAQNALAESAATVGNIVIFVNGVNAATDGKLVATTLTTLTNFFTVSYGDAYDNTAAERQHKIIGARGSVIITFTAGAAFQIAPVTTQIGDITPVHADTKDTKIYKYYFVKNTIESESDLIAVEDLVKANIEIANVNFTVEADIALSRAVTVAGKFDGKGHSIKTSGVAFANFNGSIRNLILSGVSAAAGKTVSLNNVLVTEVNNFAAAQNITVGNNVWIIVPSADGVKAGFNAMAVANASNIAYSAELDASGNALFRFTNIGADSGKIFAGFADATAVYKEYLTSAASVSSKAEMRLISSLITDLDGWNKMMEANSAGIYTSANIFTLGVDFALKQVKDGATITHSYCTDFSATLDGNGHTLDIDGLTTSLARITGVWKNLAFKGATDITIATVGAAGSVLDVWALNNGAKINGINRASGANVAVKLVSGNMTVFNDDDAMLVKTKVGNRVYTEEYASFTASTYNSGASKNNYNVTFIVIGNNEINDSDEFKIFAIGNSHLNSSAKVTLKADITTRLTAVENKIMFEGDGHSITAVGGKLTFTNSGTALKLVLRNASYTGSGGTTDVVATDDNALTLYNTISGGVSSSVIALVNGAGAAYDITLESGKFVVRGKQSAGKIFVGYKNAADAYITGATQADFNGTFAKMVFAASGVASDSEYAALVNDLNAAGGVAGQDYTVDINADLGAISSPILNVSAVINGNFHTVTWNSSDLVFGDAFAGKVSNLVISGGLTIVISKTTAATLKNVWLVGKLGPAYSEFNAGVGVVNVTASGTEKLTATEQNGAFKLTASFDVSASVVHNMVEWALDALNPDIVISKTYHVLASPSYITAKFVKNTLVEITNTSNLTITTEDREYDGTYDVSARVFYSVGINSIQLDRTALILEAVDKNAASSVGVRIKNTGRVEFRVVPGQTDVSDDTIYWINASVLQAAFGSALTVNISPRSVKLSVRPVELSYNKASSEGAINALTMYDNNAALYIEDSAAKNLLAKEAGGYWYNALDRARLRVIGADGITYAASEKLSNQDYRLVSDTVAFADAKFNRNYILDLTDVAAFGDKTILHYSIDGAVEIVQSAAAKNLTIISSIDSDAALKQYFTLRAVSDDLDETAIAELLKNVVYDVSAFLKKDSYGKYRISYANYNTPVKITGSISAGANSNFNVTVSDCTVKFDRKELRITDVKDASNVYQLETEKTPYITTNLAGFEIKLERENKGAGLYAGSYKMTLTVSDQRDFTGVVKGGDVTSFFNVIFATNKDYYVVKPCPVTLTLKDTVISFNEPISKWNYELSVDMKDVSIIGEPGIIGDNLPNPLNAGVYYLSAGTLGLTAGAAAGNYKLTVLVQSAKLIVNRAKVTVSVTNYERVYGYNSLPEFDFVYKDVNGNIIAAERINATVYGGLVSLVRLQSNAGTPIPADRLLVLDATSGGQFYIINALVKFGSREEAEKANRLEDYDPAVANYSIVVETGKFVVKQRSVKVTFTGKKDYEKEYNQDFDIPEEDLSYEIAGATGETGIIARDDPSKQYCYYDYLPYVYDQFGNIVKNQDGYNVYEDEAVKVYSYNPANPLKETGLYAAEFDNGNYIPSADSDRGTMTVVKANITVIVRRGGTKDQGTGDPTFKYTIGEGKQVKKEHISGELGRDPGEDTGSYKINKGTLTFDENFYIVTFEIAEDAVLLVSKPANKDGLVLLIGAVGGVLLGVSMLVAGSIIFVKKKKNGGKLPPKKKKEKKSKKGRKVLREEVEALEVSETEISENEISQDGEQPLPDENASETEDAPVAEKEKPEKKGKKSAKKQDKNEVMDFSSSHEKSDIDELEALLNEAEGESFEVAETVETPAETPVETPPAEEKPKKKGRKRSDAE